MIASTPREQQVYSAPAETATTIGALIGGAGNATPNDSDFVATSLTAAGILKKITWTNVKAFLKTYFDGIYATGTIPVKATGAEVDTGTDDAKFLTPKAIEDSVYIKAAYADAKVADAIADTVTTIAPSQNAVFDALALKQGLDAQLTSLAALSYAGNTLKVIRVNAGETDFELAAAAAGTVATGAEVDTGTDDVKFVSPKAIEDSLYIKAAYADAKVADAIADGVTTIAPSQNAVFDALALKAPLASPTFTGTVTTAGAIELGHASDTTFARVSAGLVSVEGKTLLSNTSTCGVGTSPTSSSTQTITHSLLRVPTIIRIYGRDTFLANNSALPPTGSIGIWCSSGNACVYQPYDATTITAAEPAATSVAFAISQHTGVGNFATGVIGNVGATTFDIVWTETGTHTAQVYLWEAQ